MKRNVIDQVFEIIQYSLNNQEFDNSIIDEAALYKIVMDNDLFGLVYPSVKNVLSKGYNELFIKKFYSAVNLDSNFTNEIVCLSNLLKGANIDHVFLKGSFLKQLYPQSYMRSMGDIDILIRQEDFMKASDLLVNNNYEYYTANRVHRCYYSPEGILIEIHSTLCDDKDNRFSFFLEKSWDNVYEISEHQFSFNIEYNLVYLLIHIHKHFNSSGIGIRSILDIGIYFEYYQDKINFDILEQLINGCNLGMFFKNILLLNEKYFGFYFRDYLYNFTQEEEFINKITDFIVISGVHGAGSSFNPNIARLVYYSRIGNNPTKGKLKYFFAVAFPKVDNLSYQYPYLIKHKWLLPWAWFSRWLKLLFKRRRQTLYKIKHFNVEQTEIEYMMDLYNQMGV